MTPISPGPQQAPSLAGRRAYDVGVLGGGIIGTAAAAFLAERGASVVLIEREEIGAGASGRNSGAIQQPFDPAMATLHSETLSLYRTLADEVPDFELGPTPAGLLLLSRDADAVAIAHRAIQAATPQLAAETIDPDELARIEPVLAAGLWACRLDTGYPVAPAAATHAFAERALRAGVAIMTSSGEATVAADDRRAMGIRDGAGAVIHCGSVLVAAGPWSPGVIPGWRERPPIRPVWGVVVAVDLPAAPEHVLEELGIDRPGSPPQEMFSMVSARGATSVGSTFLAERPDPGMLAARIIDRAEAFVPGVSEATRRHVRTCARPVAFDGRPLIGRVGTLENVFVCAGHGPWGISTGPASARLAADHMLFEAPVPEELSAGRATAMP